MKLKANNPCPCGSGKKYKHCCRNTVTQTSNSKSNTQKISQLHEQGKLHFERQQFQNAASYFTQALKFDPNSALSHFCLASCLIECQELDSAILSLERAIQLNPNYFQAHGNMASILIQLNRLDEAEPHYLACLRLSPTDAIAHNNLGHYYCAVNADKAHRYFKRAVELDPTYQTAHSNYLYALNYLPELSVQQLFAEHLNFSKKFEVIALPRPPRPIRTDNKIRLGFVSPDLRKHAVAHFLRALFEHIDRERFDLVAYHNHVGEDEMSSDLARHTLYWRNITHMPDVEVHRKIHEDQIDILIDLTGHTGNNRLSVFLQRAAPIQISWLGYPCTTGLKCIDYYLTDHISDSYEDQAYYSEQLIYLESGICSYSPPKDAPNIKPSPALRNGYITFGSLNVLCKLNNDVIDLWANVLQTVPDSHLLIYRDRLNALIEKSILSEFASRGVDPQRIECRNQSPKDLNYLSTYADIDIHLDPMPWNSHTTACEALWMGVPSITLKGKRHASRMCASVMHHAELPEFIAGNPEDYLKICKNIAADIDSLVTIRSNIRQKLLTTDLMQGKNFAVDFEAAINTIASQHQ